MRTIEQLFHNSSRFSKMIDETIKLKKLSFVFQSMLSDEFKNHCRLARIENTEMIVIVDNSVWAMKFRYLIPDLLKNLRTQIEFKKIKSIRYQIASSSNVMLDKISSETERKNKMVLSAQSIDLIRSVAKGIKNVDLKRKLNKLANATES